MNSRAGNRLKFAFRNRARMLLGLGLMCWGVAIAPVVPARSPAKQASPLPLLAQNSAQAAAIGEFSLAYEQPKGEDNQRVYAYLRETKIFDTFFLKLREHGFNLPNDVPITWANCSTLVEKGLIPSPINAFYAPGAKLIVMCYEYLDFSIQLYTRMGGLPQEEAVLKGLLNAVFVSYHELGHALIDNLSIPIAGREEDAADLFAAYFLLEIDRRNADSIILAAADTFKLFDLLKQRGSSPPNYFDEHSFGLQRFGNLVCVVYGRDPDAYANLPKLAGMPPGRQKRCPREYQQVQESWTALIVPHLLPSAGGWNNSPSAQPPATAPPSQGTPGGGGRRW